MPTTYAHWRFGNDIIKSLPAHFQEIVNKYRHEFDYGVHGPDMFFYYKIYKKNDVTSFGYGQHGKPAKEHFKFFKDNFKNHPNKSAAFSYILGYLAHFTLDSYCHTYVNTKANVGPASHFRIEAQYDRYLLIKDGKDPIKTRLVTSLYPNKEVAKNIHDIYMNFSLKEFEGILSDMKLILTIIKDTSSIKRKIVSFILDKAHFSKFKDLFTDTYEDPNCIDSNLRLDKYYEQATKHYPELVHELIDYFEKDIPLGLYFNNNFEFKEYMKDVPILSYEEEKKYIVKRQS